MGGHARIGLLLVVTFVISALAPATADAVPVTFGDVPLNTTVSQGVTIAVDAGYRTEIASGSGINAPFSFNFDSCGTGGGFVGPGNCNVIQSYTPTSTTTSTGTTNVFECPVGGGSCIAIPYTVSGTGVSVAAADPTAVSFGNVPLNTTASQSVTITVDAGYRTEIASGSGINAPFSFNFDSCGVGGGFVGPGDCTVIQRYTPTSTTTSSGTTNVFECPIAGGSCRAIPYAVSGTGISAAAADPTSIDFGGVAVNTTATHDVTITVDAGYRTEIASGSGINAPFGFDFGTCGVGGGFTGPGDCTITERYAPTSTAASSGTTNVFECPVAGGSCRAIPFGVSGHGVFTSDADPLHVHFGDVPLNTPVTQTVTLTVDTGYRTEVASGSGINAPFSFDFDTCGAGGGFTGPGTCTIEETFLPTHLGDSGGTTNVFECPVAGGSCRAISFSVDGTGIAAITVPSPGGLPLILLAGLAGWLTRRRAGGRPTSAS